MNRLILPTLQGDQQRQVLNELASADRINNVDRLNIYRLFGLGAGDKVSIASLCFFTHLDLSAVTLGSEVYINHAVYFDNGASITVGDRVDIGDHCRLLTGTHAIGSAHERAGYGCVRKPISIGAGSWLGSGVTVLPGVEIGLGCVIGAGAVVNRDCEDGWLYAGVPARKVRLLPTL
ncbi:MAG: acyltransferase [Tildeniella nuda ZEHNDER 1965/U140]|jgi:acetyltransferase-like isoleucine patch superfamily enzyme|nr:acyltransferase [Tildeniella nuda ZEHNDER 1965/U140]